MDRFNRKISILRAVSLLSLSVERNASSENDHAHDSRVRHGVLPPSFLASRGSQLRRSKLPHACSPLKKKRDCSQAITFRARGAGVEVDRKKFCKRG